MADEAEHDRRTVVLPGAPERQPEVFAALDVFLEEVRAATYELRIPETASTRVALQVFSRAFNILKGCVVLLENDHWELAASHVRQLFELTLDLEQIMKSADPDAAAVRYMRFGALQERRDRIAHLRYEQASGRGTVESAQRLAAIEAEAVRVFADFRTHPNRKGESRWHESWCNKTTKEMAAASADILRKHQYETIYRFLSAHSHAAPMAVTGRRDYFGDDTEAHLSYDDKHLVEMISMLMTFFGELWVQGQPYLPELSDKVVDAVGDVIVAMGGPTRPVFDNGEI